MAQGSSNPTSNITKLAGTTVDTNSGNSSAGTLRVVVASNQTAIPITDNSGSLTVDNAGTFAVQAAQSGTWTVQPGNTANTTPWLIKLSDGTNSPAIKAASTAAAATDPALVVAISPNNTVNVATHAVTQSGTWTVQPGNTANTTPWLIKLSDGTNSAAIKAASTAAAATDPALVVAISPNNTVNVATHAVTQSTASALQTTATQALGSAATRWYTQISDGTNSPAIKAASTAAAATDPALVVAISPNNTVNVATHAVTQSGTWNVNSVTTVSAVTSITNPLPAGTNAIGKLTANTGVIVGAVELTGATTNPLSSSTTTSYTASLVVKASAGNLYSINGYNSKTSGQFIHVYDSATLPADTSVPKLIFYVSASSNFSFDLSVYGRSFTSGIVVCNSSTGPTKTIGAADCWFDVLYK